MKPMLAATLEQLDANFPVYVQPKLDGIRCLIVNGVAVSRNLKRIPNNYIQRRLKGLPDGLDGELLVSGDFNDVQSAVMSEDGEPDFKYVIFDYFADLISSNYTERWVKQPLCPQAKNKPVEAIKTLLAVDLEQLIEFEDFFVKEGYEGIIIRSLDSPYKFGRSTIKEGYLLKFKRFKDAEAIIIGFEELNHNDNEKTKDNLGHSKRSTHKIGMRPADCLGSLVVYDEKLNIEFNIGTGFNQEQREEIWKNQKKLMGKQVTYTYQEVSSKGVPRFPVFKAFRND